jgi:hypothetical protein
VDKMDKSGGSGWGGSVGVLRSERTGVGTALSKVILAFLPSLFLRLYLHVTTTPFPNPNPTSNSNYKNYPSGGGGGAVGRFWMRRHRFKSATLESNDGRRRQPQNISSPQDQYSGDDVHSWFVS